MQHTTQYYKFCPLAQRAGWKIRATAPASDAPFLNRAQKSMTLPCHRTWRACTSSEDLQRDAAHQRENITATHSPLCSPPFSKPVFPLLVTYSMLFLPFTSAPLYRIPLYSVHSSISQGLYARKLLIKVTHF